MTGASRLWLPVLLATLWLTLPARAQRISDLTTHEGAVPVRLVGYGLVTGLDGTGDRSLGSSTESTPSVRSVINLLRRFNIELPAEQLRLRNVAAVLVTAEISPYLRPGGRFEVQVASLGDATSLRGGVLWITPLVSDPDQPPVATAQGPVFVSDDGSRLSIASFRGGTSARIAQGGIMEVSMPTPPTAGRLLLRAPDLGAATRIAAAVNAVYGDSAATVEDPGSIRLKPSGPLTDNALGFLAAVDTLPVTVVAPARIVIDAKSGAVVAGGDVRLRTAAVTVGGITVRIGAPEGGNGGRGMVDVTESASVQDIVAGLHQAGARPDEIRAVFEALSAAGALAAQVVIR